MFSRDIQVQNSKIIIVNEVYSTTQSIEINVKTTSKPLTSEVNIDYIITMASIKVLDILESKWTASSWFQCVWSRKNVNVKRFESTSGG